MKKLFAGILTLFLVLAACSQDDSAKNDKDDASKDAKKEETKKSNDKSKDDKDKDKDKADKDNKKNNDDDDAKSNENNNQGANDANQQNNNQDQAAQNQGNQNNQGAVNQQQANNQQYNQGNGNQASNEQGPYNNVHSVTVAQAFQTPNIDNQAAIQQLPAFERVKEAANHEVNRINGLNNTYNDYAITGDANGYHYVLSFHNANQQGKYFIVNVDVNGTVRVVDPAYQV